MTYKDIMAYYPGTEVDFWIWVNQIFEANPDSTDEEVKVIAYNRLTY